MGAPLVTLPVIDLDILDAAQAAQAATQLRELEPKWIKRGEGFATLGVAAYLDVICSDEPERTYYNRVAANNAIITQHFDWLLERIRWAIKHRFEMPTELAQDVALPGFHIFYGPGITLHDKDSQHFDLQCRSMRWPFVPDETQLLSFTLPIELPAGGGGLDYWTFTEADFIRLEHLGRKPSMAQIARTKPVIRHPYYVGRLAIQIEPVIHRISAIRSTEAGDHRFTLQGHAVGRNGTLVLYW